MKKKVIISWMLCAALVLEPISGSFITALAAFGEGGSQWSGRVSTSSDGDRVNKNLATLSEARFASSLGDIWDFWTGKTSFEFLSGKQGNGTEKTPFLIKNREQLMGLSQLTAMGMAVQPGPGISYAGDYHDCYFALAGTIDMQGIDWIPIGFYQDSSEKYGEIAHVFEGHFDGKGYAIKNLKLNHFSTYDYVGLFGGVRNAEITNLTISPDASFLVTGLNKVGILAGSTEDSVIRNVVIDNAAITASGAAGGLAGHVAGTVVENISCNNVKINSTVGEEAVYVGGIAGIAADSLLVDCQVSTGNNLTARIQGEGFVGGIAGFQNNTDIYNTWVSGTIGGRGSRAIGGLVGEYASGNLKVGRFDGIIANSYLGENAREGTFIGSRKGPTSNFNYVDNVSYLFADTQSKISANVCGSGIGDDNDYTYDAHIGYWHSGDLFYTLVQGGAEREINDRYFYEELEDGILLVLDQSVGETDVDSVDHFAPNAAGRPVLGYMVAVGQVDTIAGGHNFYDVAALSVQGSSLYSGPIHKSRRGAIAAGDVVYVNTAANDTETDKFQMEGMPYYKIGLDKKDTVYSNSEHCYTFRMPSSNITVGADYKKVAVRAKVQPETYSFEVTQVRSGNRKTPDKTLTIKNREGKMIATYINGNLQQGTQIQPVYIKAVIDTNNDVSDGNVRWSIDDSELISLTVNEDEGSDGYTAQSASIFLNIRAGFFNQIIERTEKVQADSGYQYKIPATIYGAGHQSGGVAVLTAQTRPSSSFEGKPCSANCRINVTFQIIDNTYVANEGADLDKQSLEFVVTRRLTGDRRKPEELVTSTVPQIITARFTPDFFSKADVGWSVDDPALLRVSQDPESYKEASVSVYADAKWIRDLIAADEAGRENDPLAKISGSGSRKATVTVIADDKLGNRNTALCPVTIRFETIDETRIVPEGISLDQEVINVNLSYTMAGDSHSEIRLKSGFENRKLLAVIYPERLEHPIYLPYDRTILWSSSDPESVAVNGNGEIVISKNASWILNAMKNPPYTAKKMVEITAKTRDGECTGVCQIQLNFSVNCIEADRNEEKIDMVITKTGKRSSPVITYSGQEIRKLKAALYSKETENIVWKSSDPSMLIVDQNGEIKPVFVNEKNEITPEWIKNAMKNGLFTESKDVVVACESGDGTMSDSILVSLVFRLEDQTYSSGSGGSISSGGGGAGSAGITTVGSIKGNNAPAGAITGTWIQNAAGKWLFTGAVTGKESRTYVSEWAYIHNPYAAMNQPAADWFRFDEDGFLVTGWYTDEEGNRFYLNPVSNGTLGAMATGWNWEGGLCYYLNPVSDGTKGRLLINARTGDGYEVNENGLWTQDGVVQRQ